MKYLPINFLLLGDVHHPSIKMIIQGTFIIDKNVQLINNLID